VAATDQNVGLDTFWKTLMKEYASSLQT